MISITTKTMMIIPWRTFFTIPCSAGDMATALFLLFAIPILRLLWNHFLFPFWWRPRRIRRIFHEQGIPCLHGHFLFGNAPEIASLFSESMSQPMPHISHDIVPRLLPHIHKWSLIYGDTFVHWFGSQARLYISDAELAKEILTTKFVHYPKLEQRPDTKYFLGEGMLNMNGDAWAERRQIMNPAFYHDKLKAMVPTMVACTLERMNEWDSTVDKQQEIDVHEEFRTLTADIIAQTAFGSSYAEGKQIFELQQEQQKLNQQASANAYIPGSRFLPTALNRRQAKVNRSLNQVLGSLVKQRFESSSSSSSSYGDDLLGLMMAANKGQLKGNRRNLTMGTDEIIHECKTFFVAGNETTANLLTWTIMLLASNPKWQEEAREEVLAECAAEVPTVESLQRMKVVGMVLNEALRLYPPGAMLFRTVEADMKLGKMTVPTGTVLLMPMLVWHHEERYWGKDANQFNPNRFSAGFGKACAGAYMPFSMGPRVCIGQTFAVLEAKAVLASILQRFRFRLSPTYRHSPSLVITLRPQFGMPVILERL